MAVSLGLSENAQEDLGGDSLGAVPRLIAAIWFGLAALVPVVFFLGAFGSNNWLFSKESLVMLWIFGEMPVMSAALLGFLMGGPILLTDKVWPAGWRGVWIALLSYPLFIGCFALPFMVLAEGSRSPGPLNDLSALLLIAAMGLIFVGWLIVIAGLIAGICLNKISRSQGFRERWVEPFRVDERRAALLRAIAIFIYLANGVVGMLLSSWTRT